MRQEGTSMKTKTEWALFWALAALLLCGAFFAVGFAVDPGVRLSP